jgi:CRP-like cAMP-binding protein
MAEQSSAENKLKPHPRDLIAELACFKKLPQDRLDALAASMTYVDVAPGHVIANLSATGTSDVQILLSGIAQLVAFGAEARAMVIAVLSPGVLPKPPALAEGIRIHFQWEAFAKCKIGHLELSRFVEIFSNGSSNLLASNLSLLFGGSDRLLGRYPGFHGLDLRHRVAVALLELSAQVGIPDSRGTLLRVMLPQKVLADMVGGSRPKVSLIFTEFERGGMIHREGRRIALSVQRLREFVESFN